MPTVYHPALNVDDRARIASEGRLVITFPRSSLGESLGFLSHLIQS